MTFDETALDYLYAYRLHRAGPTGADGLPRAFASLVPGSAEDGERR
jgi:hypothetical protein